eukprot:TRINITY_DN1023_c1_g2_i2.p1 TRINITY_DN1023_c1_g2~~TRINITY_DN1023_c1_g2_i2.p1  ORF type:complete len:122 (-),score=28.36 TRINITY_DN1023_c1_g2_i2:25-390(-)
MFQIYLATFNYLADAYKSYAASALSAQGFVRNIFGAVFPLFSTTIFENLGFQWGSSVLGFIALVLSIIPFGLIYYGPTIRAKSKFAKQSCVDPKVPTTQKQVEGAPVKPKDAWLDRGSLPK